MFHLIESSKDKLPDKSDASSEPVANGQMEEVDAGATEREGEPEVEEEVEEEEEEEEEADGASSPVDRLSQPASLPSSFHPITPTGGPTALSEPFLSLPSLPGQRVINGSMYCIH